MQPDTEVITYAALVSFCALCLSGVAFGQAPPPQYGEPAPPQYGQPAPPQYGPPAPQPEEMPTQETQAPLLSPEQLANLVAPVALYPDPLLAQVLAATTYPLELVEARQWLQQHPGLRGWQALQAAKQMNWDASVQAMVAFPDVLQMLTQDVRWTTDLGNAFLAQQADVMDAIQRLRFQAEQNGRLGNTPQQVVRNEPGPGQNAIQIQPADPQVIYVPAYNPYYVWGPPPVGAYPPLWYPPVSVGWLFGAAIAIGSLFTGLLSWSGWGWALSWLTHGLFLNGLFFNHFGFSGFGGGYGGGGYRGGYSAVTAWVHNPIHRLGVPYPNRAVASRFGSLSRGDRVAGYGGSIAGNAGNRFESSVSRNASQSFGSRSPMTPAGPSSARSLAPSVANNGWRSFGSRSGGENAYRGDYRSGSPANGGHSYSQAYRAAPESGYRQSESGSMGFRGETRGYEGPAQSYRGYSGGEARGYEGPAQSYRGYSSPGYSAAPRSYAYAAPQQHFSQNFSQRSYSEPRFSGGGGHFSEPKSSGHFKAPKFSSHSSGHSSGGHSGGHSKGGHKH
jgi:Protein of unknown function (DUF3300)